jgi:hypothetical protein
MKMLCLTTVLMLLCIDSTAYADTWYIGPDKTYTVPSAVASLVKNGDTVRIAAGIYRGDVTPWFADSLVIIGEPGTILYADGKSAEKKAIWVIKGDNCKVESIDFRECKVPDNNGAGIRIEGTNLWVHKCRFIQNQDGILCGADTNSIVTITNSEFAISGAGDGLSHGIYIGKIRQLVFMYNYVHGTVKGHEVKSRALINYIHCNRITQEQGQGSRNIDLPNGGIAIITGNCIQKGKNAENGNCIGFGLEGYTNSPQNNVYMSYNTIVCDRSANTFLRVSDGCDTVLFSNNLITGMATFAVGLYKSLDSSGNLFLSKKGDAGFMDDANYDYRLLSSSPAKSVASPILPKVLSINNQLIQYPLNPETEYRDTCKSVPRISWQDAGAFAVAQLSTVQADVVENEILTANENSFFYYSPDASDFFYQIFSLSGNMVWSDKALSGEHIVLPNLPKGVYLLRINKRTLQISN